MCYILFLIQKTRFQFGFSVLWCCICIVILMMFQVIWFDLIELTKGLLSDALYAPRDQNVSWITNKPVLTVWSERQVLPRSMRAVSGRTAAGRVQQPAHTRLRISRPAAQALLEVAHGRQGRRGGCGWRKRRRPWIMLIIKSPFWAPFRHHIRFKCFLSVPYLPFMRLNAAIVRRPLYSDALREIPTVFRCFGKSARVLWHL